MRVGLLMVGPAVLAAVEQVLIMEVLLTQQLTPVLAAVELLILLELEVLVTGLLA